MLFGPELAGGLVRREQVETRAVRRAVRSRPVPKPVRFAQRLRVKLGRLTYERGVIEPFMRARRSVLGDDAARGRPRLLVRVDEFPHYLAHGAPGTDDAYASEHYLKFHDALATAGVPYLLAVSPRVSVDPLNPDERDWRPLDDVEQQVLRRLAGEGVELGMHGLSHRTRHSHPSRRSELAGLARAELDELLDTSASELAEAGVRTRVFVPPYNRFDPAQYDALARRFDVVCGGPENVLLMGYRRTPLWMGDAVYMPGYWPFYGELPSVVAAVERLAQLEAPVWVPVVLHWGWEAERDSATLERLAGGLAGFARPWSEFFAELETSA